MIPLDSAYQAAQSAIAALNEGEAGALAHWAKMDAESLVYLADLDDEMIESGPSREARLLSVIDNAHPRWAAVTAISAVDRCAAALARIAHLSPSRTNREASMRCFDSKKRRDRLPSWGHNWVSTVFDDPWYQDLLALRNPLTHGRLPRVIRASTVPDWSGQRDSLKLEDREIAARAVIEEARAHPCHRLSNRSCLGAVEGGGEGGRAIAPPLSAAAEPRPPPRPATAAPAPPSPAMPDRV